MGDLKERLHRDMVTSMKARDELRLATLRMVLTAVKAEEVSGKSARDLSDDEVLAVLGREAKKRREAAEAYGHANRPELADRERAEGDVIAAYLPTPLSGDDVRDIVAAAIAQTGASDPRAVGQVMKLVTGTIGGRAEGGVVAAEVRRQLAGGS